MGALVDITEERREVEMPGKRGMSKERAAKISNPPGVEEGRQESDGEAPEVEESVARRRARAEYARPVLGDRDAVVLEIRRFDIHGSGFVDVTVAFEDRSTTSARLGTESVPPELTPGDRVTVSMAMNMIVAIRGADDQDRS